ncbi:winged helix-turn-helix transcriptional regulator [Streptomyces sp. ML-6]|nr:winged helix-turn-helix transcriptional regulator [Streptomyces sp. ML-6]MDK0519230.1 winged helix-turn-helix transcriptional regulator [Streptomyces sp. ML-6]
MIERKVLSTRPVAVRHRITPLGTTLRPPVDVLPAWASANMPAIARAQGLRCAGGSAAARGTRRVGPPVRTEPG